ncbi:hypothetical protein NDU88_003852 [Pleurodeles waltl]|uniref:Uncharacterized protein n=1 Tax=Pleurodeles waltl TaxID=8319 RepID=A0AAV7V1V3_PLEWA|nr:hypothetical protein NDU88_003852 [Pleurodeles waltl]
MPDSRCTPGADLKSQAPCDRKHLPPRHSQRETGAWCQGPAQSRSTLGAAQAQRVRDAACLAGALMRHDSSAQAQIGFDRLQPVHHITLFHGRL